MLSPSSVGASPTDAPGLPQVLRDAPAALLVIDLERQQVVYANTAAIVLTGERVGLPVDVDGWSDAAGLTDLGGRRMSESTSPLSLVARGVPVAGEPVAVHDAARRGSSLSPAQRQVGEVAGPAAGSPSRRATPRTRRSCGSSAPCAAMPPGRPATPAGCSTAARRCSRNCPSTVPRATPTTPPRRRCSSDCGCGRR